ncbi:HRDC domain-containing protein, partial [bacterium]|nr:HRDC domain-containing protein [bacterium]
AHARLVSWQKWRDSLAARYHLIPQSILTDLSLSYLSVLPWQNLPDLTVIPGIGQGFIRRFGQFLPPRDAPDLRSGAPTITL